VNSRALLALIRREILRGRRALLIFGALTGGALLLALLRGGAGATTAVAITALVSGLLTLLGPSGDLGSDKLLGHLEADRVLPVPAALVAAGRLLGASVRLTPIGIGTLAVAVSLHREIGFGPAAVVMIPVLPLAAMVLASMVSWTLLALNARWQFRNLWWLPVTLLAGPQVVMAMLPPQLKAAIRDWISDAGAAVAAFAVTPAGALAAVLSLTLLPIAVFLLAVRVFAGGLERYRYDQQVMGALLGKAPRRELGAIGRGALIAVARLRIRIALEQQRRQGIFLGILLIVLMAGSEGLQEFAGIYLRVLAVMLPAGIAIQLSAARGAGYLEGLQQLPHPARLVALGHLAAVAVMAAPGAVVILLSRLAVGRAVSFADGLVLWGWFAAGAWVAAVLAVWLKPRHLGLGAVLVVAFLAGWYALAGGTGMLEQLARSVDGFRRFRQSAGVALPLSATFLVAMAGVPVFARGLTTYQFAGK
jgi:hypothetical protein